MEVFFCTGKICQVEIYKQGLAHYGYVFLYFFGEYMNMNTFSFKESRLSYLPGFVMYHKKIFTLGAVVCVFCNDSIDELKSFWNQLPRSETLLTTRKNDPSSSDI